MKSIFDSVTTDDNQKAHMETIQRQCDALVATLRAASGGGDRPIGRYASSALTTLEEFAMWANKAISHDGGPF